MTATCAKCGKRKELCGSIRCDGIKQPRICKECLINQMTTGGDEDINDIFWIMQMQELGDTESLEAIKKLKA